MISRFALFLLLILSLATSAKSDTLLIIDRKPKHIVAYRVQGDSVFYQMKQGASWRWIERERVYGVRNQSGSLDTLYVIDTLENNWRSAAEMAEYIQGQNDALRHYSRRTVFSAAGGLLVGGMSSGAGILYGPFGVLLYTGLVGIIPPSHKSKLGFNQWCIDSEPYRDGFDTAAKRKAVRRAALFAGIGYATGLIVLTAILP